MSEKLGPRHLCITTTELSFENLSLEPTLVPRRRPCEWGMFTVLVFLGQELFFLVVVVVRQGHNKNLWWSPFVLFSGSLVRPPLLVQGYSPRTKPGLFWTHIRSLIKPPLIASFFCSFVDILVRLIFCLVRQFSRQPSIRSHGPRPVSIPLDW